MTRKLIALLLILALAGTAAACGGKETTVSGMVVSVNGTVLSVTEMSGDFDAGSFKGGEKPDMSKGSDGEMPEGFDGEMPEMPEGFDGEMPEMPEGFDGEMPENFNPEDFDGEMPQRPDGDNTQAPSDSEDGSGSKREDFFSDAETTDYDIANAHISVESDGEKASGTIDDISRGSFVTLTLDRKGNCTNVVVTGTSFFGGKGKFGSEEA